MRSQLATCAAALCLLSACDGTSDDVFGGDDDLPRGPAAYVGLARETLVLANRLDDIGPTSVPLSGTARYDGTLLLADDAAAPVESYLGDFAATANFDTDTLSGSASGFFYDDEGGTGFGTAVPGTVTVTSADTRPALFALTLSGTVDLSAVSGSGTGLFAGPGADMLVGQGDGTVAVGTEAWDMLLLGD